MTNDNNYFNYQENLDILKEISKEILFENETLAKMQTLTCKTKFKESLNSYIKRSYQTINALLRATKSNELLDIITEAEKINANNKSRIGILEIKNAINQIKNLDNGFKYLLIPSDIIVFRRVGAATFGFINDSYGRNDLKTALEKINTINHEAGEKWIQKNIIDKYQDQEFLERGYLSTSFSNNFHGGTFQNALIQFEIWAPKGTRAITITSKEFDGFHNEKELLFDRGYSLKLKEIKIIKLDGKNRLVIKAEIIPNNKG